MVDSLTTSAFLMGLASAVSLPLGAITAAFWRPGDRVAAALVAFGSGALLAALSIDLVAPAFHHGQFYALAAGCVLGGLLFVALNELVNNYGGFLRKASTTIYHLRRQEHRRYRNILSHVGRIDIFADLPEEEFKLLAGAMEIRSYDKGASIYRLHDPAEALYVLAEGRVDLLDPRENMRAFQTLAANDAFGRMAFLTGAPHATTAVATEETSVWVLPRAAFNSLLGTSPTLQQAMQRWLRGTETSAYLRSRHRMTAAQARRWADEAVASLALRATIPPAVAVEHRAEGFQAVVGEIRRLPVFGDLPGDEVEDVAQRLIYKVHRRGQAFFHKDEHADRMYIIDHGEVSLMDPSSAVPISMVLTEHDAFGSMSFLTGSRHAVSAVATRDTAVWVLRRSDFQDLLKRAPELARRMRMYVQSGEVAAYLREKHRFDPATAARWAADAVKHLDAGRIVPPAERLSREMRAIKGAPLAIWLGIMLDGVPESLVIGAGLVHPDISLALVAGVFLSNYPEALFSSLGMRRQGMPQLRVVLMWSSIMISTALGAALGSLVLVDAGGLTFAFVEGVAAGAMLTMIAQTMLPEAYIKGGSIIGLTTLLGFLAALFFKSL